MGKKVEEREGESGEGGVRRGERARARREETRVE